MPVDAALPLGSDSEVEAVLKKELKYINEGWAEADSVPLADWHSKIHELHEDERPIALCLSGGGIRSATFCLGVLQSFARTGRLGAFHYLSTVSGGGYIGGLLSNWLRLEKGDLDAVTRKLSDVSASGARAIAAAKPGAIAQGQPAESPTAHTNPTADNPVARLRAYSNYLSPVWGLSGDSLSLVAIFLRNLLLNWLVWLPLLVVLVLLPRLYIALLILQPADSWLWTIAGVSSFLVVMGIAYVVADLPVEPPGAPTTPAKPKAARGLPAGAANRLAQAQQEKAEDSPKSYFATACFLPILGAAVMLSIAGAWAVQLDEKIGYGSFIALGASAHLCGIFLGLFWRKWRGIQRRRANADIVGAVKVVASGGFGGFVLWTVLAYGGPSFQDLKEDLLLYATFSVPAMLAAFWLAMTFYAGIAGRRSTEDDREWWARSTAWWLYASIVWVLAFGLPSSVPQPPRKCHEP